MLQCVMYLYVVHQPRHDVKDGFNIENRLVPGADAVHAGYPEAQWACQHNQRSSRYGTDRPTAHVNADGPPGVSRSELNGPARPREIHDAAIDSDPGAWYAHPLLIGDSNRRQ